MPPKLDATYEDEEEPKGAPPERINCKNVIIFGHAIVSEFQKPRHTEDQDHQQNDADSFEDIFHLHRVSFGLDIRFLAQS